MTHQDDLHANSTGEQPSMELLEGEQGTAPVCCSTFSRVVRGTLYGVLLLSATSLLAISAVPELTNYLSFLPGNQAGKACHLSSTKSNCTTLSAAALENLEGSPCCPLSAAMVRNSGGCSKSCESASVAAVSAETPSCCQKGDSACEQSCPLAALASNEAEEQPANEDALAKLSAVDLDGPPAPPLPE